MSLTAINISPSLKKMIDKIIGIEGGFVDDPKDSGGATRWGITERVARQAGYVGPMRDLPRQTAVEIFAWTYYQAPRFHLVEAISLSLAMELFEIEVNLPPGRAAGFLQRALRVLNDPQGSNIPKHLLYPDPHIDGHIGNETLTALQKYLKFRGGDGLTVLLRMINSQQAVYYMERCEAAPKNERFIYGWVLHRVKLEG